jgi:hypothetical protein
MARVVAEMYRIENVIYVRIKAVADHRPMLGTTARLLCYRPKGRLPIRLDPEEPLGLESLDPQEPVHR